jgi:sigma-E factor negative regulatory protein RseB
MSTTDWLHKMEQALDQQSFSGRFVHVIGNKVRSLQMLHTQINGDTYERLTHLDGPKREIIRQGQKIYCYFPGKPTLLLNQPAKPQARLNTSPVSRNLNLPINAIEAHYRLSQLSPDRIAGLAAIPLRLTPRDAHRYQYEFWLEANSGLLIKSIISTSSGEALENFEFTQLELNAKLSPSDFDAQNTEGTAVGNKTPSSTKPNPKTGINATAQAALPDWQVIWLPEGFVQTHIHINSPQQPHNPLAMKLFTDGLASFSIFIESLPLKSELLPSTTQGATLSTSRWLDAHDHRASPDQRYAATLLGEIPMQSAKKIIESIQFVASH